MDGQLFTAEVDWDKELQDAIQAEDKAGCGKIQAKNALSAMMVFGTGETPDKTIGTLNQVIAMAWRRTLENRP